MSLGGVGETLRNPNFKVQGQQGLNGGARGMATPPYCEQVAREE